MTKQHAYEIASKALESRRQLSAEELQSMADSPERITASGPDGQTFLQEGAAPRLARRDGFRLTVTVDLGSSFRLERIEESIEVLAV